MTFVLISGADLGFAASIGGVVGATQEGCIL